MATDQEIMFSFSGGEHLNAQQLGYFAFRWSSKMAESCLDDFSPGRVGSSFSVASSIVDAPFIAHLYLTSLHVATYLSFSVSILGMSFQGVSQFFVGLRDSIADLRAPNGMPLDSSDQQKIIGIVERLTHAIDKTIENSVDEDAGVFRPSHSESTKLILSMLVSAYSDVSFSTSGAAGMSAATFGIGNLLDDVPVSLMKALQQQGLKILPAKQP